MQKDPLREQYEREKALYEQYQREKAMAEQSAKAKSAAPAESTSVSPRQAVSAPSSPGLGEEAVGLVRTFMNRATGGLYGKAAGALNQKFGGGATAEEIAQDVKAFQERNKKTAALAGLAGDVAPYFFAAPEMAAAKVASIPALARGYQAARSLPVASKLLPASGKTAAQIIGIEGARGAGKAEEGESVVASALKSATTSLPFGRLGEVAGTYFAGKMGKSIDKMQAEANAAAQKAGNIINQWREVGQLPVTPALSKLYGRSKDLREAVNAMAESLGLPATDPHVLTEAYSKLSAEATPVFRDQILRPFLQAIDDAASPLVAKKGVAPLSEGIKGYAKAMKIGEAITKGRQVSEYLRTGAGVPEKVGPTVVAQKMMGQYVSQAEREAAAQAAIAAIGEQTPNMPSSIPSAIGSGMRMLLTGGPRGVPQITDFAQRLGGGSFGQQLVQRIGTGIGASPGPFKKRLQERM